MMATIGEYLKNEREKKQKTLKDISLATKISRTTLEAIEQENFKFLPPPSYVRGFIRLYAHELEINPEEAIELYEQTIKESPDTETADTDRLEDEQKSGRQLYVYVAVALLVIIAGMGYGVFRLTTAENSQQAHNSPVTSTTTAARAPATTTSTIALPPPETTTTVVVTEQEPAADPSPAGDNESVAAPPSDQVSGEDVPVTADSGFTLKFVARELTWIRISVDEEESFEIMLRDGETFTRTAGRSVQVRIGNPGGLSLFFNDTLLRPLGEPGTPVNLRFPDAAQDLLPSP